MSIFKRFATINQLSAPVQGQSVNLETIADSMTIPGEIKFAVQPNNDAVYAPLNGEVTDMTSHHIAMTALSGDRYWLTLQPTATTDSFDWQVRVGDSISPLTLLGTLNAIGSSSLVICSQLGIAPTENASKQHRLSAIFG